VYKVPSDSWKHLKRLKLPRTPGCQICKVLGGTYACPTCSNRYVQNYLRSEDFSLREDIPLETVSLKLAEYQQQMAQPMEISIGSKKRKGPASSSGPGKYVLAPKKGRGQLASTARLAGSTLSANFGARAGGYRMMGSLVEKKAVDLPNASYALDTTGTVTAINLIRTGSGYNNRVGRKISMTSVEIRGYIAANGATPAEQPTRIMILYDKQANGALPAVTDVLQAIDQAGNVTTNATSPRNLDKRDRFVCVYDEYKIAFGTSGVAGVDLNTDESTTIIHKYIRLPNLVTQYQADSSPAVIGDIATGSLFLLTFGQLANGATSHIFQGTVRLRYKDA